MAVTATAMDTAMETTALRPVSASASALALASAAMATATATATEMA